MPTYDYGCANCGNRFEIRQRFSDEPVTSCPKCHHEVRRLLHAPAIIYKGSGFYTTDYKNTHASLPDRSRDGAPSEEAPKSEKSDKTEKASESKPSDASAGDTAKGETKGESSKESTPSKA